LTAHIIYLPERLVWDAGASGSLADAFAGDGYRIELMGALWNASWRPFGGDVESCGFASTPDGAKQIANDPRRRNG
jgi:hypothetical protein